MQRRPCAQCSKNRQEKFFVSPQGRVCADCRKKNRRATARRNHVQRTYGLSLEDYERLQEFQGGVCAICGGTRRYNLCVDHCHESLLARGLLCKQCNRMLGQVSDDPAILRAAADYLENPPTTVLGITAEANE